jgi:hypothetical protein
MSGKLQRLGAFSWIEESLVARIRVRREGVTESGHRLEKLRHWQKSIVLGFIRVSAPERCGLPNVWWNCKLPL